ncbi:MAG: BLUF domain-containing protein [Bacteroidota bacterium]
MSDLIDSAPIDIVGLEPPSLHAIAYVSTPTVSFSDRDLSDLLLASRRWNAQYGVTGKLVVLEEEGEIVQFAQWIEGAPADLEACFARITSDGRHRSLDIRRQGPVEMRRFPDWDMAIEPVDRDTFEAEADRLTRDP